VLFVGADGRLFAHEAKAISYSLIHPVTGGVSPFLNRGVGPWKLSTQSLDMI
jgi:hypothetical protein